MERKRESCSADPQSIIRARANTPKQTTKRKAIIEDGGGSKEAAKCNYFTKPNHVH